MKSLVLIVAWTGVCALGSLCTAALLAAEEPPSAADRSPPVSDVTQQLRVLQDDYPRAYFFRASEALAADPKISYAQWDQTFSRLMGIEGKALDEEVPGRSRRNIAWFTRFKRAHPDQLVLLHYNGNARDPRYETEEYFAGHWLYHNGAAIVSDIRAEDGATDVRVSNTGLFKTNTGRYRDKNEDVGICMLDANGRPDWSRSEQVRLISVDHDRGVIRIRRGCYGTRPCSFPAGRSYAAAHVCTGPWGRQSNLLWRYNYSTACPKDATGANCVEVHVEELAEWFLGDGPLAPFDGIEFDVLFHQIGPRDVAGQERGFDCDADGKIDNGFIDDINTYGIGVIEFCRRLQERLAGAKLVLADGMGARHQRAFGILNGIESEGWPTLSDWEIRDWSGGLNRHWFWRENARPPVFNYINHKYTTPGHRPGQQRRPDVPAKTHRLVLAAAQFTDAAVCYSLLPAAEEGELIGVWDELWMGVEHRLGWLGKPLAPAVQLARRAPDLLDGQGRTMPPGFVRRWSGDDVHIAVDEDQLCVSALAPGLRELKLRLRDVPCRGPDLFVSVTMRGDPMAGYPPEVARLCWVGVAAPAGRLVTADVPDAGMQLRGRNEGPLDPETGASVRFMTWVNRKRFASGFYFSEIKADTVDLEFVIEGSEPVWVSDLTVHAHPDAIYREFENGVVLANPAPHEYAFEMDALFAGHSFRRIKGSPSQDPETNNGSAAARMVTLQAQDGLFLLRTAR